MIIIIIMINDDNNNNNNNKNNNKNSLQIITFLFLLTYIICITNYCTIYITF